MLKPTVFRATLVASGIVGAAFFLGGSAHASTDATPGDAFRHVVTTETFTRLLQPMTSAPAAHEAPVETRRGTTAVWTVTETDGQRNWTRTDDRAEGHRSERRAPKSDIEVQIGTTRPSPTQFQRPVWDKRPTPKPRPVRPIVDVTIPGIGNVTVRPSRPVNHGTHPSRPTRPAANTPECRRHETLQWVKTHSGTWRLACVATYPQHTRPVRPTQPVVSTPQCGRYERLQWVQNWRGQWTLRCVALRDSSPRPGHGTWDRPGHGSWDRPSHGTWDRPGHGTWDRPGHGSWDRPSSSSMTISLPIGSVTFPVGRVV